MTVPDGQAHHDPKAVEALETQRSQCAEVQNIDQLTAPENVEVHGEVQQMFLSVYTIDNAVVDRGMWVAEQDSTAQEGPSLDAATHEEEHHTAVRSGERLHAADPYHPLHRPEAVSSHDA